MKVKLGDEAPDFELASHRGGKVRLSDLRGRKNVLIAFHPFAWTPVCERQMAGYEAEQPRLTRHDAQVLSISADAVPPKAAWANSLGGLSYDLLSDFFPHGAVAGQYGVLRPEGFPERAVFVVDKNGTVVFAKRYDLGELPDMAEPLTVLEQLG
ncbi:MAG TPA: redoxin domain-containing protein [Vicinamibacterales bacterium]|jgi:peroxiredoxin|nr:redoxin domain-containing protein [Vicinamibacterales bacterium]